MFRAVLSCVKRLGSVCDDACVRVRNGVSDEGGSPGARLWARTWLLIAPRAGQASARSRNDDRRDLYWRVVLLGLSGLGSIAVLACVFTGHAGLAFRVFAATLLLLGVLLAVALR